MIDSFQLWRGALSKQECNRLIKECESYPKEKGLIGGRQQIPAPEVRETDIAWVKSNRINRYLSYYFTKANEVYNFNIYNTVSRAQYTVYTKGSFYDWHMDTDLLSNGRKLSITIQLSDPKDYEGGDFEFKRMNLRKIEGIRDQGSILVFPSYLYHRVTKVTKGTRRCLVAWMQGPRWI